ncbi:MAG TPA: GTP-binding protein, partial [Acidimicrobiales bacterium]
MISLVEDGGLAERAVAAMTFPRTGRARIVGVTGAPGAGKSSLVDRLVAARRANGQRVAVVAVDPSSPVSGGAVLGDRLRMQRHATDPGVFIRSM